MREAFRLRFGVHCVQERGSFADLLAFWRHIEAVGYDWISLIDHFIPVWTDPDGPIYETVTSLAALAANTRRVRIGTLTLCNNFRHPAVLAKSLATIDHLSSGRLEPGIGAGWNAAEHAQFGLPFPKPADRVRMLDEGLQIIRLLWTQERTSFEGRFYQLVDARCSPKPLQKPLPRIWVGGSGEQMMLKVVARLGGGWNPGLHLPPSEYRRRSEILERNCEAVGRDPAEIKRSFAKVVVCGENDAQADDLASRLQANLRVRLGREENIIGGPKTCAERLIPFLRLGVTDFVVRMPLDPIAPQLVENFMTLVAPIIRDAA